MHGQENYGNQVGQGSYAPQSSFQQYPAAPSAPPPPPNHHHGPLPPPPPRPPQVVQHGHPSFQLAPGSFPYPQGRPSVPQQRSSSGMHRPYLNPPPPQQGSTQVSYSGPTSQQQFPPWSQNVHQLPPTAPSAYPLPSSQGYNTDRGPAHQTPFQHAQPPPPPPYASSSNISTPNPSGSSVLPLPKYSYLHPSGQLPPPPAVPLPPPPPPPPPLASPPRVPPLPPTSPPSDNLLNSDGVGSLNEHLLHGDKMMLDRSSLVGFSGDGSVHTIEAFSHSTLRNRPEVEAAYTVATHSPADSDMDMEDDITQPDEEKQSGLSDNLNNGYISTSQELDAEKQLLASHHTGGDELPKVVVDECIHFAGSAVSKDPRVDTEFPSTCDTPVTREVFSEAGDFGVTENRKTEKPIDIRVKKSPSQHEIFSQASVTVGAAETGNESSQLVEGANSFKLLQSYASDGSTENEGENFLGDVSPSSVNVESTSFGARNERNFESKPKIESLTKSKKLVLSKSLTKSPKDEVEADKTVFATGKVEELAVKSRKSIIDGPSKDSSRNYNGDEGATVNRPDVMNNSDKLNVDEFGRMVREGVSDSDTSDSPRYTRKNARRDRKRTRSPSRSRSPHDRRRKRSPRRRNERRGRSRSSSPKRRRSRSRSPILRRGSEFVGDKMRREKGKLPECFDFLRGKCYRGASCRYSHHESDKSEQGRYNRGKQHYQDRQPRTWSPDFSEEGKAQPASSVHENKEMKDKGLKPPQDMPSSEEATDVKEFVPDTINLPRDKLNHLESSGDGLPSNLSGFSSQDLLTGKDNYQIQESSAQDSDKIPQIGQQHKEMNDPLIPESSFLLEPSAATFTDLTADKPDTEPDPTGEKWTVGSPLKKPYATEDVTSRSHLPLASVSQVVTSVSVTDPVVQPITQDYNLMPLSSLLHSKPENNSNYQAPVSYQHPHFPQPSNSLSSSFMLPPPPPRAPLSANVTTGQHNIPSLHMQQSLVHPQNDLHNLSSFTSMRPYSTESPAQSQAGQYQAYPSVQNSDQIPHFTDDFRSRSLPRIEDNSVTGHLVRGMNPLHSVAHSQPNSSWMHSATQGPHASVVGDVPSNSSSSHSLPYFQQASYGLQYSVPDGFSSQLGNPMKVNSSMSRTTGDFLEMNPHSHVPGLVGSRISNHFNPYASTFDQPLNTKFSLNASSQENNKPIGTMYGAPFPLSSVSADAHQIGSVGSKNMITSSSSARVAESFSARPGGDQYDPLFDSIEPSLNSLSRTERQNNETIGNSDDFPRLSGSGKQLNRDNIEQEGGASISANDSLKIEECGETADAEVGAVVNGSPSNSNDATDLNEGEIEIDQVKASGKRKKGKDSRSSNLFKISIASFVKEVLKPSWRQGNMSKEAFKTIVKKTVDKVSGAMKSHKVPRTQSKINHYIDSSRGKLTKLVMGYVDKYVKM